MSLTPAFCSASPDRAVTTTGTSCKRCSRFCAVTMMSPGADESSCAATGAATETASSPSESLPQAFACAFTLLTFMSTSLARAKERALLLVHCVRRADDRGGDAARSFDFGSQSQMLAQGFRKVR